MAPVLQPCAGPAAGAAIHGAVASCASASPIVCVPSWHSPHLGQVHVLDVLSRIVVADLAARPVHGLHPEQVAFLDLGHLHRRGVGVVGTRAACARRGERQSANRRQRGWRLCAASVARPRGLTAGMSGCQRLCSGFSCSHGLFLMSTVMSGVGVRGGILHKGGRRRGDQGAPAAAAGRQRWRTRCRAPATPTLLHCTLARKTLHVDDLSSAPLER